MAFIYSNPSLPSTAPLRLTVKSPQTPSPFSSQTGYTSPMTIRSATPLHDSDLAWSNPRLAPTPSLPKRMKSTPILQQKEMFRESNTTMAAAVEVPIVAPTGRQSRIGRLSGRLGGLVLSTRKGRPNSNSAESGIRVDITSSRISSSPSKHSPTSPKSPMEGNGRPPSAVSTTSPTSPAKTPKRKWPFTSSSFWPRPTANPTISECSTSSPRDSSEVSISSQEDDLTSEEDFPLLRSQAMPLQHRSTSAPLFNSPAISRPMPQHSLSTPLPEKAAELTYKCSPPTITVTLPARTGLHVSEEQSGRERSLSELFDGLFILSSGGKTASTLTLSTINEQPDVPQLASEQSEEEEDEEDMSRCSSSFESSGELLEAPRAFLRRTSSAPSTIRAVPPTASVISVTPPLSPEEELPGRLQTKRSSSALPLLSLATGLQNTVAHVDRAIAIPSPQCSPISEGVSPIIEEAQDDEKAEEHAIYISIDDTSNTALLADDQWTLRAESIVTETAGDELSQRSLPRYSQLLHSPSQTAYNPPILQTIVDDDSAPKLDLPETKFPTKIDPFTPPQTPDAIITPPPRMTSLALPPARPLRSLLRDDIIADSRTSQQWDREKVTRDVRQVVQRLRWDKAQKAWQLVREAENAPPTHGQISTIPNTSNRRTSIAYSPTIANRAAMLPPGKMEWALVDSAAPSNTGQPGLVFRLCIAWRVTPEHNTFQHPFGVQEELKVFVLGRTREEFYQLHEGLMGRFMLEPRRHAWTQEHEMGPRAMGCLEPMDPPMGEEEEGLDFTTEGSRWEAVRENVRQKVDVLEAWTQGLMRLKHTNMGHVLESEFVRAWMAPRREGDCERSADSWRKNGYGEIGRDSEGIARVLERLW